jgi:TonB-dependent starch-binding outer membrane protein SusC
MRILLSPGFITRPPKRITLPVLFLLLFLTGVGPLKSQDFANAAEVNLQQKPDNGRITLRARNEKLTSIFQKIEKLTSFVFVYSSDDINGVQNISIECKNAEIGDVINLLTKQTGFEFEVINDKIIVRTKSSVPKQQQVSMPSSVTVTPQVKSPVDVTISGRVADDSGYAVSGASVAVKGTNIGTVTDADGNFSLAVPESRLEKAVLVVSFVGFDTKEFPINGRKQISIALQRTMKSMEDVVVVGYGTQRRLSVTGSVDKVGSAAISGRPVTNLSTALQGTSPNLIIQQSNFEPGQPVNINIRGLGTLGNNTPLVVIDGIVGGDINLLNPADIESVSILKDAGTAAIYGSRSANGVILITTKKGRKNQKPLVSYTGIYGTQSPRITYKPVHAWENAYYKNESLVNSGLAPAFTPQQIRDFQERGDGDWQAKNLFHDASQQTHTISVSGGGANSSYNLSFGLLDQNSNFIGPDYGYKRYNLRLNQTTDIGRLKLNTIFSYVKVNNKDQPSSASTLIVDAGRVPLYYSFQDTAGNYLTNPVSAQFNPKAILEKGGYRKSNDDEIFGNISADFAVTKEFHLRAVAGGTVRDNNGYGRTVQLNFIPGGVWGDDRTTYNTNYKELNSNVQLMGEYTKSFGVHDIKLLVGASNESFRGENNALYLLKTDSILGVPTTGTKIDDSRSYTSKGTIAGTSTPATIESSLNSLFGRASYAFNNIYFAEFNFRYDGSSKFLKSNRWGFFPSGAVAVRLTENRFLQGFRDHVGDLKLRGSYGILGNQNVADYQYQTSFFNYANAYALNNTAVGGAGVLIGNPQLTWEKAATFNVGIDGSFLKQHLDVSFDFFDKTTRDILYKRSDVPQLFGAAFPDFNVAKVRNRGWEFKATYNHSGRIFSHSVSVNLADNLNELLQLTSGATEEKYPKEEITLLRRVGQPITVYYGFKRDGYFQNLDQIKSGPKPTGGTVTAGDIRYVDKNGDGVIDDNDKFIIGNPFPRYTFGFTYNVRAKGFDLMIFVQGVGKRDQFLRGEQVEPFHVGYGGTMYTHQTDYWTPTNPNATWPRLAENGSASNANNYKLGSTLQIFDAAYARLKNVQFGYTIPGSVLQRAHISKARIYVTAQNLLTLTKLQFLDPEITEFNNATNPNTGSNSARAYFMPIFHGAGLDLTF